jgi:putative peptidoglycan lipid II flippase
MDAESDTPRSSLAGFRTVSLLTLISRVLGFARDSAMAGVFGLGEILDAFTLAFRIPNLARSLFGEGALATAFLPAFLLKEKSEGSSAARRLAGAVASRLAIALSGLIVVAELGLLAWHSITTSGYQQRLVELLALMTPYLGLICLAALAGAMLQAHRRFVWPALVPVLLNLWWLAAVAVVSLLVTDPERRIRWIAGSLLVGGGLQLALPAMVLARDRLGPLSADEPATAAARGVFRAMIPTVLAASITQFNTVVDSLIAWLFASPAATAWSGGQPLIEPGTAAALYFAQRLYQFPLGLIGVSVGTVLFPTLAAHAAAKNFPVLARDLSHGLCTALSVALPASAGLAVLSAPLTAALFQHGRFSAEDAQLTSRIMAIYGGAAWAAIALLIKRGYFAVGDRRTPLKTGLIAAAVNLILSPTAAWLAGGIGLAMATSATTLVQLTLSLFCIRRTAIALDWTHIAGRVGRALAATVAMGAACLAVSGLPWVAPSRTMALGAPLVTGVVVYLIAARRVGLDEPWELVTARRRKRVDSSPRDE